MEKILCVLIILILLSGCLKEKVFEQEQVLVIRVIDGDTVELFGGQKVRLIGIDSTERGEKCYTEAKEKLISLVESKTVLIEKDVEEFDKYERLLGYLFIEKLFVNLEMIESGNAKAFEYGQSNRYAKEFEQAEENAQKQKLGCLWNSD